MQCASRGCRCWGASTCCGCGCPGAVAGSAGTWRARRQALWRKGTGSRGVWNGCSGWSSPAGTRSSRCLEIQRAPVGRQGHRQAAVPLQVPCGGRVPAAPGAPLRDGVPRPGERGRAVVLRGQGQGRGGALHEYYGAAEPPVRGGASHLSGQTEPPKNHFPSEMDLIP